MALSIAQDDLVYGLSEPRHDFLISTVTDPHDFTIDTVNNTTISLFSRLQGLFTPENLVNPDLSQIEAVVTSPDFPRCRQAKNVFDFHFLCRAHLEKDVDDSKFFSYLTTDKFIRNRCKYGILWALWSGRSLYFVTDSINFKHVFSKSPHKMPFVTGHEMRFIYRLCLSGDLPSEVKSRIKFIKKNSDKKIYEEVKAPWESDPTILHGYAPKMVKKSWNVNFSVTPSYVDSPTHKLVHTIADTIGDKVTDEPSQEELLEDLMAEMAGIQDEIINEFNLGFLPN